MHEPSLKQALQIASDYVQHVIGEWAPTNGTDGTWLLLAAAWGGVSSFRASTAPEACMHVAHQDQNAPLLHECDSYQASMQLQCL